MKRVILALLMACAATSGCSGRQASQSPQPATLVLTGGRIVTLDDTQPEAEALAVRDDRIVALGSAEAIRAYVGPATKVIDLHGFFAMPGFIEGHAHFTEIGEQTQNLDLSGAATWDEIVAKVAQAAAKATPGQWIVGSGWHQDKWRTRPHPNVEGFPTHESLDRVSPDNPVVLTHASGHAAMVNAKAMALSGITRATADPPDGQILKDPNGSPTGLLRETAADLVKRGAGEPAPTPPEQEARGRAILAAADQEVIAKGITSFQDAGSSYDVIDRMKRMTDEHALHVRLWVMAHDDDLKALAAGLDRERVIGYGNNRLTVRAIKMYMDGALGSRGAWLLAPYSDKPDSVGLPRGSLEEMRAVAQLAVDHGYQLATHAIGDRANRETLNVYEDAFRRNGKDGHALRWRIEHAQHLAAADIPRFAQLGVIASMQPVHATSDAVFVLARLGAARAEEGAYVWQKLMQSGAVVTAGTDAPVEDVDPIANYYAAVTRQPAGGPAFYPDQKMSRLEALRAYTRQNAFAAFEEDIKGSLAVGKLADVTVLTKDITRVPDDEIRQARVAYTIIGGRVVYQR